MGRLDSPTKTIYLRPLQRDRSDCSNTALMNWDDTARLFGSWSQPLTGAWINHQFLVQIQFNFFLRNCARHNKHGKSSNKPIPDDCSVLCLSCQWRAVQQTELRGKSLVTHKKSRGTVPLFWCNTLHFSQTTNELTESGAELFSYFFLRQYMVWKNIKY